MNSNWQAKLRERQARGNLRKLRVMPPGVDFCSNDYLGLTRNAAFQERLMNLLKGNPALLNGATGSRLISGNSDLLENIEKAIANRHQQEAALLFPSGYVANLALLSCLPQKGDYVLLDEQIHRSVHDGCRMNHAQQWKFKHNDLAHLEALLQRCKGKIWILVESLYSMDGDVAPLQAILALAKQYQAQVIVDEAHAIGVYGLGLLAQWGLSDQVFATVVTYGKAMGSHGAAVLGSATLKEYLVNFASPLIYSTAMPLLSAVTILEAYRFIEKHPKLQGQLQANIAAYQALKLGPNAQKTDSSIQPWLMADAAKLKELSNHLLREGFQVYPILPPTVAEGTSRLRITLHSDNSIEEINALGAILNHWNHE